MRRTDHIKRLIEQHRFSQAEAAMAAADETELPPADRLYLRGLTHAKHADWSNAKSCFLQAAALDAQSPAAEAIEMITDIYDFYYKDNLNP